MAGLASTPMAAADELEDPSSAWLIAGAAMVGISAALQVSAVLTQRDLTQSRCLQATCVLGWGSASLLEPMGASFLAIWAWQLGNRDGHIDRGRPSERDRRTLRDTGAVVAGLSYLTKTLLFGYAVYKTLDCTLSANGGSPCRGQTFSNAALISLAVTPTLALGALAAGYGTGYERGKESPFRMAIRVQPAVIPGGAMLALRSRF